MFKIDNNIYYAIPTHKLPGRACGTIPAVPALKKTRESKNSKATARFLATMDDPDIDEIAVAARIDVKVQTPTFTDHLCGN